MKKLSSESEKALLKTKFPHNVNMFTKQVRKEFEDNEIIKSDGWNVILTEKGKEYLKQLKLDEATLVKDSEVIKKQVKNLKIYTATIVANNSCYLETVLVVAESKEKAHDQLCEKKRREVKYTQSLKELDIDFKTPTVIEYAGWGNSDDD